MARALRMEWPGGRYLITARGNESRNIFHDDRDREHFLDLLAELPERFGTRLHAYVMMNNHYHLVLETPEANLSRAGQWLNVSYSIWFNRRHRRSGHLSRGRFGSILMEGDAELQEVGRYVHLGPVRVLRLGLGKESPAAVRSGLAPAPSREVVKRRLQVLRQWRWSSYRAYAGYAAVPPWLYTEVLGRLCGGRSRTERRAALRAYTECAVREGLPASPWERLLGGVVLGSEAFVDRLCGNVHADPREQAGTRQLERRVSWEQIVKAVEAVKGEAWMDFRDRHGDWGRDVALWLGRRLGRMTLSELARRVGVGDYTTVGAAVSRIGRRLVDDAHLRALVKRVQRELSVLEI